MHITYMYVCNEGAHMFMLLDLGSLKLIRYGTCTLAKGKKPANANPHMYLNLREWPATTVITLHWVDLAN